MEAARRAGRLLATSAALPSTTATVVKVNASLARAVDGGVRVSFGDALATAVDVIERDEQPEDLRRGQYFSSLLPRPI
jgi:hypothetical protein